MGGEGVDVGGRSPFPAILADDSILDTAMTGM